jgi:hypothetical protein
MAGSAPEGSQFDARQYDARMDNVYVKLTHPFTFLLCAPPQKPELLYLRRAVSLFPESL